MDLVAGAMGNVASKLLQLLQDEYKLHKGVKERVRSLAHELQGTHIALSKVAQVPYEQLDPQVKLWASRAREASYDMEDILDKFLVRVHGCHQPTDADNKSNAYRLFKKVRKKFSVSRLKAQSDIAGAIDEITKQVDQMAKTRDRCKIDDAVGNSATTSIDPRVLMTFHTQTSELVGTDDPKDSLIKMLSMGSDDASDMELKIVSVVGSGGLGKTTLAKLVYDKLTVDLNIYCKAFVPVGRTPDLKKVLRDILLGLDRKQYINNINFMILDERQLIEEIRAFLEDKRYFIVIDDVWDEASWMAIKSALQDNNLGSKIMITTRSNDVAELVHCTYKIQPLHPDSSKILFYGRIFGSQDRCPEFLSELSDKILKKCHGVPLAIITIASLLSKQSDDITKWQEVCNSIGYGLGTINDMRKILSLSYYDLPSHMKTCFLYLSMYPEDYEIQRDRLVWRWISEGFIQPHEKDDDLFDLGEGYFNDLINRSLVQPVVERDGGGIYACRVHDMILDLICYLSREENFVTTSEDIEKVVSTESKKHRRLSLKSTATWPTKGVSQVRSIAVFQPPIEYSMPSFSCFDMLRVLDLEGCSLNGCGGSNKLYVGTLIHLRYLGLSGTRLAELPRGIEKLRFLQVLKMDGGVELPDSIFEQRQLMCLEGVKCCPRSGNLLRNLASLQVLDTLYLDNDPKGTVEALGNLTQLKQLSICIESEEMLDQRVSNTLIDSLSNLARLQYLQTEGSFIGVRWESWAPPPNLRLVWSTGSFSETLPKWICPASVPHLTCLDIEVHTILPEDIQILGKLPNLAELELRADLSDYLKQALQKFVVGADAFPRSKRCWFNRVAALPSMFTRGAMPRVEVFYFTLRARDFFSNGGFEFDDLAMDHLPSLRTVHCQIYGEDGVTEEEATNLREALKHAADVHPNHPNVYLYAAE